MVEFTGVPRGGQPPPPGVPAVVPAVVPATRGDTGISRGTLFLLRVGVLVVGPSAVIAASAFHAFMIMFKSYEAPQFVGIREVHAVMPWVLRIAAVLWLLSMTPRLARSVRLVLVCASGGLLTHWAYLAVVWAVVRFNLAGGGD